MLVFQLIFVFYVIVIQVNSMFSIHMHMGCHEIVVALFVILEKVKDSMDQSSSRYHFILIQLKKTSPIFNILKFRKF